LSSPTVTPTLQRLAGQAARDPQRVFTTLAHLIDADFLHEAYRRTSKSSAPGIDGVTARSYAEHLDEHRHDLHERLRSGRYQAAPVERVWIEKDDGGQRPIGKPAFEDKIVQRAVAMLLEAIYEQDFLDCSYGFRPGRSPHQALHALRERCMQEGIGWIVDADVSGYFDSIDRTRLREVLRQRVNDGRIMRLIGKWLRAGVMEDGELHHPETGVVQGGVISPVLANIFLHHVLDEWFEREVRPRLKGRAFLIRFADDFCIGCEREGDARKIMAVLPKRFARFGLTIHPEKTALIAFGKPDARQASAQGNGTFEFLGLTHYWAKSRRGFWVIKRRAARKRLRRTQKALWRWCRANRHAPVRYQYQMLCLKLRGHFRYYGIRGNFRLLEEVRRYAEKAWRYWLSRRSSKSAIGWEKFQRLLQTYVLPTPKIVHTI
jgi:RNA-directed DNA polymerase